MQPRPELVAAVARLRDHPDWPTLLEFLSSLQQKRTKELILAAWEGNGPAATALAGQIKLLDDVLEVVKPPASRAQ